MTDRPIIFSAPMVRALLEGRKTQTRRLLSIRGRRGFSEFGPSDTQGYDWHFRDAHMRWHDLRHGELLAKLPWHVGDRLWVRENCWAQHNGVDGDGVRYPADGGFIRAASSAAAVDAWDRLNCYAHSRHPDNATDSGQLVPSIHMPRWASRLTLTVTDVRVQELLDISEEDAAAEGCSEGRFNDGFGPTPIGDGLTIESPGGFYSAAGAFQMLWQKIHPDWDGFSSPHVVALTFTVEQRNIDA